MQIYTEKQDEDVFEILNNIKTAQIAVCPT
jgi:hypothetical protein